VYFDRKVFIYVLALLADIFSHMNEVNLSNQGPAVTIKDVNEKSKLFQAKFSLWKKRLETDNFANFSMLEDVLSQDGINNNIMPFIPPRAVDCSTLSSILLR